MRSFKGTASFEFKVTVPDTFVQQFREAAQQGDASQFFKIMQAKHPVNDDAFIGAVISNALRLIIRNGLADQLIEAGLGGSVSPVKMDLLASSPDHDAPVNPQTVQVVRRTVATDAACGQCVADLPVPCICPTVGGYNPAMDPIKHDCISHGGID